jgi:trans-aconitate 2-methyltransferase
LRPGKIIDNIANHTRWKDRTDGVSDLFTIHDYSFYYDILSSRFNSTEIWETHYLHVLENHVSILEMIRSTGLKPYLERLADDSDKKEFEDAVLKDIETAYPIQKNGTVLFPFKRLFFTGSK